MDRDDRTTDTGRLGSDAENPGPGHDSRRTDPATTPLQPPTAAALKTDPSSVGAIAAELVEGRRSPYTGTLILRSASPLLTGHSTFCALTPCSARQPPCTCAADHAYSGPPSVLPSTTDVMPPHPRFSILRSTIEIRPRRASGWSATPFGYRRTTGREGQPPFTAWVTGCVTVRRRLGGPSGPSTGATRSCSRPGRPTRRDILSVAAWTWATPGSPQPLELGATPDQSLRRTAPVGGTDRRVLKMNWSGPYLGGRLWV
jgi:hypothetical protein